MIKHIVLRGVSSYCPDTDLSIGPLTKVNLFYGHNRTGKTTIGNFLQAPTRMITGIAVCSQSMPSGSWLSTATIF